MSSVPIFKITFIASLVIKWPFLCNVIKFSRHCVGWLEDSAYFAAIDETLNTISWYDWPETLKNRHLSALEEIYQSKRDFVRFGKIIGQCLWFHNFPQGIYVMLKVFA